jgi:hypothetical protein
MQIGSNGFNQNYSPAYNNTELHSQSIQHQSYLEKTGDISITTDEGDIVTFNQSSLAALEMSRESFATPLANGMTFTASAALSESMSFSVQGDLNEQELADIASLYDSLTAIAGDFFNGDYGKAMVGAMSLGDLGSLASLEASFTQTQISSTQITTHHILPSDSESFIDAFSDKDLFNQQEARKEQDLLAARWQQITDFLDQQNKELQKKTVEEQKLDHHTEKMMQEVARTLEKHPRLSPFAVPLAGNAIQEAASLSPLSPIQNSNQTQFLKNDFLKQFHNWLEV